MEPKNMSNSKKITLTLTIAVLIGLGVWQVNKDKTSVVMPTENPNLENTTPEEKDKISNTPINTNRKYKDGTYTAIGGYISPAGEETVEITLVVKNDVVISGTSVTKATNPVSVKLQNLFKDGFNEVVAGKSIDELSLTVVNGSSLTPKGFMDALMKIKEQAIS